MQLFERDFPNVLYHYTAVTNALSILQNDYFRLNAYFGGSYSPEDFDRRFYYLSTTRTHTGKYHRRSPKGVIFVLDRDKLQQNYKIRPLDYWKKRNADVSEAEDRIVSDKPIIKDAHKYILEVHVWHRADNAVYDSHWDLQFAKVYLFARQKGIPAYYYRNEKAWQALKKSEAETPDIKKLYNIEKDARRDVLKGRKSFGPPTDYIAPWVELHFKNKKEDMSPRAQKLVNDIQYGWYVRELPGKLSGDIQNVKRNPTSSMHSLIQAFRELGVRLPREYVNKMVEKWGIES